MSEDSLTPLGDVVGVPLDADVGKAPLPTVHLPACPTCPTCEDMGFITDGELNYWTCECRLRDQRERYMTHQFGKDGPERFRFARWNPELNPTMAEALKAAQAWSQRKGEPWLVIEGRPGIGKTFLAKAAAGAAVHHGHGAQYYTVPSLLDDLRPKEMEEDRQERDALKLRLKDAKTLILDEFGAEVRSKWTVEQLGSILVPRYDNHQFTLICANSLANAEERLQDRFRDTDVVNLIHCTEARSVRGRV